MSMKILKELKEIKELLIFYVCREYGIDKKELEKKIGFEIVDFETKE